MIGAARSALAGVLSGAGIRTFATVPERITPPLAILRPASDWVQSGDTFGAFRIGFEVLLIVQTAANSTVTDNLDDFADDALAAIADATGFYVDAISEPTLLNANGADYLSASMTVYQNTTL